MTWIELTINIQDFDFSRSLIWLESYLVIELYILEKSNIVKLICDLSFWRIDHETVPWSVIRSSIYKYFHFFRVSFVCEPYELWKGANIVFTKGVFLIPVSIVLNIDLRQSQCQSQSYHWYIFKQDWQCISRWIYQFSRLVLFSLLSRMSLIFNVIAFCFCMHLFRRRQKLRRS